MSTRWNRAVLITLAVAALVLSAAQAQAQEPATRGYLANQPQFEVFVASFASDIPTENPLESRWEPLFGLRGSYPVTSRFALEGGFCKAGNADLWLADVSAKVYLKNRGRTTIYALGGPGVLLGDDTPYGSEMTVHLGVGLEIQATRHVYVRPEVRQVWIADDFGRNDTEFALGVGWRM